MDNLKKCYESLKKDLKFHLISSFREIENIIQDNLHRHIFNLSKVKIINEIDRIYIFLTEERYIIILFEVCELGDYYIKDLILIGG